MKFIAFQTHLVNIEKAREIFITTVADKYPSVSPYYTVRVWFDELDQTDLQLHKNRDGALKDFMEILDYIKGTEMLLFLSKSSEDTDKKND